ncbi:MAG TPA: hypothetical protein VFV95_16315 [Vicinamibacterales bacterium]|nr:hypothetical protein [Vicinamibacterales bacterium]
MSGIDPYARSLVLWLLGVAAVIYAAKIVWRVAGRSNANPAWRPPRAETFLVGMAILMLVMAPVHMAQWKHESELLERWNRFLLYAAAIALAAGFLSGVSERARPMALGLSMAWPSAFYAAMAWALFLSITSLPPPPGVPPPSELDGGVTPFLTLLTAFPVASFACGIVGGVLGGMFARRWSG